MSVTTAGAPASLRVLVWRKLRALGGLYVQQSVCLLPSWPGVRDQLDQLAERIDQGGGHCRILAVAPADAAEERGLIGEMNAERDTEYAEVLERFAEFFAEIEIETGRGNATFAEVEESEADLGRFRDWLAKIAARDYFDAPGGEAARAELGRAERVLADFETRAMAADEPMDRPRDEREPRLRAVGS